MTRARDPPNVCIPARYGASLESPHFMQPQSEVAPAQTSATNSPAASQHDDWRSRASDVPALSSDARMSPSATPRPSVVLAARRSSADGGSNGRTE